MEEEVGGKGISLSMRTKRNRQSGAFPVFFTLRLFPTQRLLYKAEKWEEESGEEGGWCC